MTAASCDADSDVTTKVSHYDVDETVSRLQKSIQHAGLSVLIIADQTTAADPSALEAQQQLIVLADPRTRADLMSATPLIALDLPMKMLVWRDGALVKVSFKEVDCIRQRYDLRRKRRVFSDSSTRPCSGRCANVRCGAQRTGAARRQGATTSFAAIPSL